jgi:hypothetical protein
MGKNMPDEQHLAVEMDRGNHAELVPAEVEDVEVADSVRREDSSKRGGLYGTGPASAARITPS